jgi:preprotein translocase subunit YajC
VRSFLLAQQTPLDLFSSFIPVAAILAIFYFLVIMPARRRQKKLDDMIKNLKIGDRVITTSGIYGTIAGIKDSSLHLKVADQVKIEVAKSAVAGMQNPEKAE